MKSFDLSQYMLTLSQAAGAGKVGYDPAQTYAAGTVGAALKGLAPTTLTQGSVVFAGASGALSQDNAGLFWDDANNKLGVNMRPVTASSQVLHVGGEVSLAQAGVNAILFNNYFDTGHKASNAGYGSAIRFDNPTGLLSFYTTTSSVAAGQPLTTRETLRLSPDNRATFYGPVYAPTFNIDGPDNNFYLSRIGGTTPLINFDGNDYLAFDKTSDTFSFNIATRNPVQISPTALFIPGDNRLIVGDANVHIRLDASGGNVYYAFDANDFISYERGSDAMQFNIGGVAIQQIFPNNVFFKQNVTVHSGQVLAQAPGQGGAGITGSGNASNSGYLSLFNNAGARIAYVGYIDFNSGAAATMQYINEVGDRHHFNGQVGVDGSIYWGGPVGVSNFYLSPSGGSPVLNWGPNRYIQYLPASEIMAFWCNGSQALRLETTQAVTAFVATRMGHGSSIYGEMCTIHNPFDGAFPVTMYQSKTHGSPVFVCQHQGAHLGNNVATFNNGSGGSAGTIVYTNSGNNVAYGTSSDVRLKENIVAAPDGGAIIDALEIVSFDWKEGGAHTDYGMIAQATYEVFPAAVVVGTDERTDYIANRPAKKGKAAVFDEDGKMIEPAEPDEGEFVGIRGGDLKQPWMMDNSQFVPLLIKEIQQLRARVAALEALL